MAQVLFKFGTPEAYAGLGTYEDNALYFIQPEAGATEGVLYKGSVRYSPEKQVEFVAESPASPEEGKIYVVNDGSSITIVTRGSDGTPETIGGGTVQDGAITDIGAFDESVLVTSTGLTSGQLPDNDTTIPTSGAVKDAIETAVSEITSTSLGLDGAFVNVQASPAPEGSTGTVLTFTPKSGEPKTVTIADLFLSAASYSNETHILTLTVGSGSSPSTVEVNLEDLVPEAVDSTQVAMNYGDVGYLTATVDVGNIKAGDKISLTDGAGNVNADTVQAMFAAILSKDKNPTTTQPSASVTLTGAGEKEVGTQFTPSYSANLNPGSYNVEGQGTQATGVTATTYAITDTNSGSADTQTGSFTAFTVEDDTDYYVSATISYGDGNIPKTFLGNNYPEGQIKAGSKSATSSHVKGFRNCWWGFKSASNLIADPTSITSAQIKALGTSNKNKPNSYKPTGNWQQMFFAVPATQAKSLSMVGTDSPLPQTVQGPVSVQVGGVGDHSPIAYNVFYVSNATEQSADTFKLTWSNS